MAIFLSAFFSWMFEVIKKYYFLNSYKIVLELKLGLSFVDETSPIAPTFLKALYKRGTTLNSILQFC